MEFDIGSFLAGLFGGGSLASLVTYKMTKSNRASGTASVVDQSNAKAGGDITGGNKTVRK